MRACKIKAEEQITSPPSLHYQREQRERERDHAKSEAIIIDAHVSFRIIYKSYIIFGSKWGEKRNRKTIYGSLINVSDVLLIFTGISF